MSGNSCDCPNPPGGRVICRADQLAVCRVKDGKAESQCVDKPTYSQSVPPPTREQMLKNWALAEIKREQRDPLTEISFGDDDILRSGAYYDPRTGETVTFSLPAEVSSETPVPAVMSR